VSQIKAGIIRRTRGGLPKRGRRVCGRFGDEQNFAEGKGKNRGQHVAGRTIREEVTADC